MLHRLFMLVAVCLLPIYLWESGGIQISHILIVIAALLYYISRGVRLGQPEIILLTLALVVALRESAAAIMGGNVRGLLPVVYVLFCIVVFNSIRHMALERRALKIVGFGLFAAVAVAITGILVKGYSFNVDSEGYRAIGTFNNPNQLGYFAVCSFAMAVLLHRMEVYRGKWHLIVFFAAAVYLSAASLSKAAILTTMLSGLMIGFSMSRSKMRFLVGSIVAAVLASGVYIAYAAGAFDDLKVVHRLSGLGTQGDDSLAGRGYNVAFSASGLELFIGMGSQKVREIVGHEVHSTYFSYFTNYGVIGGLLFVLFIVMWLRSLVRQYGWYTAAAVGGPPLIYGITHNGSRFTVLWILIALSFVPLAVLQATNARQTRKNINGSVHG